MWATHAEMVSDLFKSPDSIVEELTPTKVNMWHAATGIAGEAGEVVDEVKKHIINGKPLDRDKLVKELGDVEFYLEALRQAAGITRNETIDGNIEKLSARYHTGSYSDAQAAAKADILAEHGELNINE